MKRFIGLAAVATAFVALPTLVSHAGYPTDAPLVATNKPTFQTGEGGNATASNYKPGVAVSFSMAGDFAGPPFQSARATVVSSQTIGSAVANGSGIATISFTAPAVTGAFTITATQGALSATATISVAAAPTTTTTAPATTTTAPATTAPATTAAATTTAPTTTSPATTTSAAGVGATPPAAPSGGLPSTGTNSMSWVRVAAMATVLGVGLLLIATRRRRSRLASR